VRAFVAVLVALLYTSSAVADDLPDWVLRIGHEKPPAFLLGEDEIEYVVQGAPAPFEGMVLDLTTATRWTLRADWQQKQLELNADTLRAVMRRELEAKDEHLALVEASYKREIKGLREDLREQAKLFAKAQKPPFYRTAAFGFAMGILVSTASTVALTMAFRDK
jgi:hypothetical protein